jgi:hypothetical protein
MHKSVKVLLNTGYTLNTKYIINMRLGESSFLNINYKSIRDERISLHLLFIGIAV